MLPVMADPSLADQLLDAHVAYVLDRLSGDALTAEIATTVDDALTGLADVRLDELVDAVEVKRVVRRLVADVPATAAATTLVSAMADAVHEGPPEPFSLGELIGREHVETLVDEALALGPVVQRGLDQLAESPLVATVASRFVARIVGDVLSANRSVAEKIPGVGGLMSLGAGAASRVMGAADKQLEQILGDTAGKGAAFAMRRLNKIVADTLNDPMTRDAALQVWDQYCDQPLAPPRAFLTRDDSQRVAALLQEIVASGAPTEPVGALVDTMVDVFFEQYGEHSLPTLLEDLEVSRDDLVADIAAFAPAVIEGLQRGGHLERSVRTRLAPFYGSDRVTAILS
jgi:hypothetical protein